MIIKLKNPMTDNYDMFKKFVIGPNFPWFWLEKSTSDLKNIGEYHNWGFFSHAFLLRPGEENNLYSKPNSEFLDNVQIIFNEILFANNIKVKAIHRVNANCVMPTKEQKFSMPHHDHDFPHKNCLIYLTNTGGNVRVFDGDKIKEYHPNEDDVIIFEGKHCLKPPKEGRRISIIVTYS